MVQVIAKTARELSEDEWRAWHTIQAEVPGLASPFFHPQFTRIIDESRGDVEVGVLTDRGEPVGFFPFQRIPGDVAQAVCGRLSEFHGVIARPETEWHPRDLLRGCRLAAWHFDHLPASQARFESYRWGASLSPYMDLSEGYDAYRESRKKSGSQFNQVDRKRRKLERELGTLRFELQSTDAAAFAKLLEWKSAQYRRTNVLDVFEHDWVRTMLDLLRDCRGDGFEGAFSALWAGDRVAAVHLGLLGREGLHMWFPAFDVELQKHSPGTVLLTMIAQACAERGLVRIDLGKGTERYKQSLKSDDSVIWEGSVDRRPLRRTFRHAWYGTKTWIRTSKVGNRLVPALEASRKFRQWAAFR